MIAATPSPDAIVQAVVGYYILPVTALTTAGRGPQPAEVREAVTVACLLMAHAGHTNGEIARALGRAANGIGWRFTRSEHLNSQRVRVALGVLAPRLGIELPKVRREEGATQRSAAIRE